MERVEFDKVICEKEGNIAHIIFNYPEKLNPLGIVSGTGKGMVAALDYIAEDDDVKVVIIKGAGRCFSSGYDISQVGFVYGMGTGKAGERRAAERKRLSTDRELIVGPAKKLFLYPKITIAQVHGHCIGGGFILVSCCDLAVAAEDAQFSRRDQRLGFAGNAADFVHMTYTIGLKRTMELLLTGRTIDGKEAERIGLVNKAVPADKLEEETNILAESVALLPRDGIAIGKAMREITYDTMGLTAGLDIHVVGHTFMTNLRWEEDEYNFFKERRDKGLREAVHERDERYIGKID